MYTAFDYIYYNIAGFCYLLNSFDRDVWSGQYQVNDEK